ncbi:MAG: hypothetical protein ABWK00_02570 [Desulfurococcaceae archaeon]
MNVIFVDAWIRRTEEELLMIAKECGVKAVAAEGLDKPLEEVVGLRIYRKVVFAGDEKLKEKIRGVKRSPALVSVVPLLENTARWAAHDGRIDTLVLTNENAHIFDRGQLGAMKHYGKPLELAFSSIFNANEAELARLAKVVEEAFSRGLKLVISTAASEPYEYSHPWTMVALVSSLVGTGPEALIESVSANPLRAISLAFGEVLGTR